MVICKKAKKNTTNQEGFMSLEKGGFTDKFGNSYESYWVSKQLLSLLNEELLSATLEPLGEDETGVDVIVEKKCGDSQIVELHQCKSSQQGKDNWTLATLDSSGVLSKAFKQIERNSQTQRNVIFKVVSPLSFNQLKNLSLSAKNNNGNATDFLEHQIKTNQDREKLFTDLCKKLNLDIDQPTDVNKAIQFLTSFEILNFANSSDDKSYLTDKTNFIFLNNEPEKLIAFLQSYPLSHNKLRSKITANMLFADLKNAGFIARKYLDNTSTPMVLDELNQKFTDSIEPFLLQNTLIQRQEMQECLESIKNNKITLVKAEAGMGKSVFLYELHTAIQSDGNISLPIRLDRQRPQNNADSFGKLLGFSQSPVQALSSQSEQNKVVIVLDQLDAIRWTANHSNNALQVCQEIARQIIDLPPQYDMCLVMACRDFDIAEDIALKSWITALEQKISKLNENLSSAQTLQQISLGKLPESQITEMIADIENYQSLPDNKKDILCIPIWLSFYLQIADKTKQPPKFDNKLELIRLYWDDRIKQLEQAGINLANVYKLIEDFVAKASQRMQYAIPLSLLNITDQIALQSLISVGIFHKNQQDNISFQHQALFDYQLGKSLYDKAQTSPEELLHYIGDKSQQTLTRREHLKYTLNLLLQDKQATYAKNISAILFSQDIRFHLKYLAFYSLRELAKFKSPIKNLVISKYLA